MRWLSALIRNGLGLILGFFTLPWCVVMLLSAISLHQYWPRYPVAVISGAVLGVVFLFVRKPNKLLHTVVHEASHALLCLVLFVRLRGISATDGRGGEVQHDQADPVRSTLISIAPYTVPLVLGPILLARMWWQDGTAAMILSGLCSFFYIAHLQGLVMNVRLNFWGEDADLPKVGRLLALVLIVGSLLLLTTALIHVVWKGGAVVAPLSVPKSAPGSSR